MYIHIRNYGFDNIFYGPDFLHFGRKWSPKFNIRGAYIQPTFYANGTGNHFTKNKRQGTPKAIRKAASRARRVTLRI